MGSFPLDSLESVSLRMSVADPPQHRRFLSPPPPGRSLLQERADTLLRVLGQ
jgi:hypothetical protein